jgi:ribosomal protein S18 acetylase RimI-like enzyme
MSTVGQFRIRPAAAGDIPDIREMLKEYVQWIGLDLAFQEIDEELAGLPGDYAPPRGALLVGTDKDSLVAMIGLRPIDDRICEMKRLFVRPTARGRGLARQLIDSIVAEARRLQYDEIRLDTLPMMGDAQKLYVAMGFADIDAYYDTPIAGTRFMALRLRSGQPKSL